MKWDYHYYTYNTRVEREGEVVGLRVGLRVGNGKDRNRG